MSDLIISEDDIDQALDALKKNFLRAISKHGGEAYEHKHQILGDQTEEYHELIEAVTNDDLEGMRGELLDIAAGALWSVISIDKGVVSL